MPVRRSGASEKPSATSREGGRNAPTYGGGGTSPGIGWSLIFGFNVAVVAGGVAILWPVLKMAGTALAVGMVVALVIISLTPLLLLRTILRSAPASNHESDKEEIL